MTRIIDLDETAVSEAAEDALLLQLAIDDLTEPGNDAWDLFKVVPKPDYRLLLLTEDQVRAVERAVSPVTASTEEARRVFYGERPPGQEAAMRLVTTALIRAQLRFGLWIANGAIRRLERRARFSRALTRVPRSLPPYVAA